MLFPSILSLIVTSLLRYNISIEILLLTRTSGCFSSVLRPEALPHVSTCLF